MIHIDTEKLQKIDYANFNYNAAIVLKLEVQSLISQLDNLYETNYDRGIISPMTRFAEITDAVFGFINNPYKVVHKDIKAFYNDLKHIDKELSAERLLEDSLNYSNTEFFDTMKYSFTVFGYHNRQLGNFLGGIEKFNNAIDLYNKAYRNRRRIMKKYLGFKSKDKNGVYYRIFDVRDEPCFYVLVAEGEELYSKEYRFDNWSIWESSTWYKAVDERFEDIFRLEFPENYV